MTMMPQMAAALTYLKGLKPANKAGFAFGSYGWAKGGANAVDACLKEMKFNILREPIHAQYMPDKSVLNECREAGRMMAEFAQNI
jgi:flavorubredoxin